MWKFTIRDLVLLTLVSALGVGWWVDRARLAAPLAKLAEYERAEQHRLMIKQMEKRLKDLEWKLHSSKAVNEYGAPNPGKDRPRLTGHELEEMIELYERLARERARE
jgi:hypothetical protein